MPAVEWRIVPGLQGLTGIIMLDIRVTSPPTRCRSLPPVWTKLWKAPLLLTRMWALLKQFPDPPRQAQSTGLPLRSSWIILLYREKGPTFLVVISWGPPRVGLVGRLVSGRIGVGVGPLADADGVVLGRVGGVGWVGLL